MVSAWLKQLSERWFGGRARPTAGYRPGFERLEERDVPSANFAANIVPKSFYLGASGQLSYGTDWGGGTGGGFIPVGVGGTYGTWGSRTSETFHLNASGVLKYQDSGLASPITVLANVQDFTISKNGTPYALVSDGTVEVPGGSLQNWFTIKSNIYYIATNYNGNGDIWAVGKGNNLFDLSQSTQTAVLSGVYDFAFGAGGASLFVLTTINGNAPTTQLGGTLEKYNLATGATTTVLQNAWLADDWEASPSSSNYSAITEDYWYHNIPNTVDYGNGLHGMDISGTPV
jgi:hypothetical protein